MSDYDEAMNKLRGALLLLSRTAMKEDFTGHWLDLETTFKIEDEAAIVTNWLANSNVPLSYRQLTPIQRFICYQDRQTPLCRKLLGRRALRGRAIVSNRD